MGSSNIKIDFIRKGTLGKNNEAAGLDNTRTYGNNLKIKKSEILSVFTTDKEKQIAEKLFDLYNANKSGNGEEEVLAGEEIEKLIKDLSDTAKKIDYNDNLSEAEAANFLKTQIGADSEQDVNVFFKFVKQIGKERDFSKNIKSGNFKIDGVDTDCEVEPDKSDKTGRTYTVTDYKGGKKYSVAFGGKEATLQVMTSELYALGFNNLKLVTKKITDENGTEGVVNSKLSAKNLDKSVKLGMDGFLGNTSKSEKLNFSGAFDIDSNNEKKSFTFIPDEFDEILDNGSDLYSHKNLVKAFSTIANLKDEDISAILKKYNYDKQYGEVLSKRKEFFANMLDVMKKEPLPDGVSVKDYLNNVKVKVMKNKIGETTDKRDIIAYQKSIDKISDTNTKIELQKLLNEKNTALTTRDNNVIPVTPVSMKDLESGLETFGYKKGTRKINTTTGEKEETYYVKDFTEKERAYFKEKYGENADKVMNRLKEFNDSQLDWLVLRCINQRAKSGVNFLESKESFYDLMTLSFTMNDVNGKRSYDAALYSVIVDSNSKQPDKAETEAITMYKGDDYWQINNSLTKQHTKDLDIPPRVKNMVSNLTNYLNKASTAKDITTFRGEGYEIFKSIKLSNGQSLGETMEKIAAEIPKDGNISDETRTKINELISQVQDNNYTATQERYLSTSADSKVAKRFGQVSLILNLPAGSKAVCLDAVNMNGKYSGEAEILCQRGSQLQISDIAFDETKKRWTITANVITN